MGGRGKWGGERVWGVWQFLARLVSAVHQSSPPNSPPRLVVPNKATPAAKPSDEKPLVAWRGQVCGDIGAARQGRLCGSGNKQVGEQATPALLSMRVSLSQGAL